MHSPPLCSFILKNTRTLSQWWLSHAGVLLKITNVQWQILTNILSAFHVGLFASVLVLSKKPVNGIYSIYIAMVQHLKLHSIFSTYGIYIQMCFTTLCGGLLPDFLMAQFTILINLTSRIHRCPQNRMSIRPNHNTRNSMPYSLRIVCNKGCETGPSAYSPYPRRLETLTICWCNYKGSNFYSVVLRHWLLVRPESNSLLPA